MSGPLNILIEPRARAEVEAAARWWAENRPAAPTLLLDELEHVYELLRSQPHAGQPAQSTLLAGIRRVLLGRARYHLYYRVLDDRQTVVILALWHASRGHGPDL